MPSELPTGGVPPGTMVEVRYPLSLAPGDERTFPAGLTARPFWGRIVVKFDVSHINVRGHAPNADNEVMVKGRSTSQELLLKYEADVEAPVGARKEIGVWVYRSRIAWIRAFGFVVLMVVFASSSLALIGGWPVVSVQFAIAGFVVTGVPMATLLAAALTARRMLPIASFLLEKRALIETVPIAQGSSAAIRIVEKSARRSSEDDVFSVRLLFG